MSRKKKILIAKTEYLNHGDHRSNGDEKWGTHMSSPPHVEGEQSGMPHAFFCTVHHITSNQGSVGDGHWPPTKI